VVGGDSWGIEDATIRSDRVQVRRTQTPRRLRLGVYQLGGGDGRAIENRRISAKEESFRWRGRNVFEVPYEFLRGPMDAAPRGHYSQNGVRPGGRSS